MHGRYLMAAIAITIALSVGLTPAARAGNQKEEALADSVRLALSRAITDSAPPKVRIDDIDQRIAYLHWLGEIFVVAAVALATYALLRRFRPAPDSLEPPSPSSAAPTRPTIT